MPTNLSTFLSSNFEGAQGLQGLSNQGLQGTGGSQGLQGLQGLSNQGLQGRQGSQGLSGLFAGQGTQGAQGTFGPSTIPQNSQVSGYTLQSSDIGKHISITTGGVTIPISVFSAGDAVTIFNNSGSNQTITAAVGTTVRYAGTASTGNRTLSSYGLATVLCFSSNNFVITGMGLT